MKAKLGSGKAESSKVQNFRALPHAEVGAALAKVRSSDAYPSTKLCLTFLTLTATRSGEARLAEWSEIDLDTRTWTIPAERMKAGRQHRVPLSQQALDVLQEARSLDDGSRLIFPSVGGRPLGDGTISKLLRERGIDGHTARDAQQLPQLVRRDRRTPRAGGVCPGPRRPERDRSSVPPKRPAGAAVAAHAGVGKPFRPGGRAAVLIIPSQASTSAA